LAMARESLEEARRSVLDLRASPPAAQPLPEALAALARAFTTETGVRVHVRTSTTGARTLEGEDGTASGDPRQLPLRVEAELYRIVQEALANVRKHAHAREVQITLRLTPRTLRLTVRDDGRGFEPGARPEATGSTGHGLQGMRERARLLGGSLRLASRPGRGTAIVAIIPLLPAQE